MRVIVFLLLAGILFSCGGAMDDGSREKVVYTEVAIRDSSITDAWLDALVSRESARYRADLALDQRPLSREEQEWEALIRRRASDWHLLLDSLAVPFEGVVLPDSIRVLVGYKGSDDGFTFLDRTVCLDLTALANAYGPANDPVNADRIDRIFSHEYTHLLHKAWARNSSWNYRHLPIAFYGNACMKGWACTGPCQPNGFRSMIHFLPQPGKPLRNFIRNSGTNWTACTW